MRSARDIYMRAVILQCLTNRICLETQAGAARTQSPEEREALRLTILQWLEAKGYEPYLTDRERWLFQLPVGVHAFPKDALNELDAQCKAMDVFLWVLGRAEAIPPLSQCEIGEYHQALGISAAHDRDAEAARCTLRPAADIALEGDIAFLWDWRLNRVDQAATRGRDRHITDLLAREFGSRYDRALPYIHLSRPATARSSNDFVVLDLVVRELYKWQLRVMQWSTHWRAYAFRWMESDAPWGTEL